MVKNIVVFSDGTGQEGGVGNDSNVYKLFKVVENRTQKQISFYDSGLGSGGRKILSLATGIGISKNIKECYRFIFENFEAGDKIYLFGFSRGAATVRSLAGFIHAFGILPKSRPELIKKAYSLYRIKDKQKRLDAEHDFQMRHHTMWTCIEFVGVWDTVAALGVPLPKLDKVVGMIPGFSHNFHDFNLSASISNAAQALSIDEERKTFLPTLWNAKTSKNQTMEQVWFLGAHTDVGGGYDETGLSDIPFHWMVEKAEKYGLRIYNKDALKFNGDANATMHDERKNGFGRMYRKGLRFWPEKDENGDPYGAPSIHPSVKKRVKNRENCDDPVYSSWISPYLDP
jgi:uncharacterized protein (DUF2235 family)